MRYLSRMLAIGLVSLPVSLAAQAPSVSDNVQATANVLANLTVAGQQDLTFGDVLPGFAKTIAPDNASAGRYLISGTGTFEVSLDFGTLPTDLSDGMNLLPITFGPASAGYGPTIATVASTFDPGGGVQNANLVANVLYVFIGGTVTPAAAQTPGVYSELITLTVAYTGN